MPKVIRKLLDESEGHPDPRTCSFGSDNVRANGVGICRRGDLYNQSHVPPPNTHFMGPATGASDTVFINGKGVHRAGDAISCGDFAANGSPNVRAN